MVCESNEKSGLGANFQKLVNVYIKKVTSRKRSETFIYLFIIKAFLIQHYV